MRVIVYSDSCKCPVCGAEEMHPNGHQLLIRGFKVFDTDGARSQCLVCSGGYNKDLEWTQSSHDTSKGWFCTRF